MSATPDTILPSAYFDGLSTLWGGCAYVASSIVAVGLVFQTVRSRPDAGTFVWLLAKVLLIGLSTAFIREWLMHLNDIIVAFGDMMGIDPTAVDDRYVQFVAGKAGVSSKSSVWDVIWGTQSFGTALCYGFLWLFGWLAWGVQYVVKLIGGVLLTAGWALSPIFLSFFMLRPMVGVAQKYIVGLVALVLWPFGWVLASVVTNALLDAASTANLMPVVVATDPIGAPAVTGLLIGAWMLISSFLAPWITTRILLMGVNPAAAVAQSVGGVMQAAFSGGTGAAVAAATGGAGTGAVIAAAVGGAMASSGESAAKGGGNARGTSTAIRGLSGYYSGSFAKRSTEAAERSAAAKSRQADAAESMASEYARQSGTTSQSRSGFNHQPHEDDPNQAALDI